VRHGAWGWEGHVDARWRLCRRAAFNGSVARFKLVVSVVGYLFASLCLFFPFVCLMVCWWCRLDLKLYVNAAPLVCEGGLIVCHLRACCLLPLIPLGLWWMLPFYFVWRAFAPSLYRFAGYLLFWLVL
jgi:hypothetical protein